MSQVLILFQLVRPCENPALIEADLTLLQISGSDTDDGVILLVPLVPSRFGGSSTVSSNLKPSTHLLPDFSRRSLARSAKSDKR